MRYKSRDRDNIRNKSLEFLNAYFWMNLKAMFCFKIFLKPYLKISFLIDGIYVHWQMLPSLLHRSDEQNYIYLHKSTRVTLIQSGSAGGGGKSSVIDENVQDQRQCIV